MLQTAWEWAQSSAALHDSPLTCSASGLFYCIHVAERALSMSCVFMHLGAATERGEVPYSSQPLVPFPKFQWRLLAQCKFDVSFRPGRVLSPVERSSADVVRMGRSQRGKPQWPRIPPRQSIAVLVSGGPRSLLCSDQQIPSHLHIQRYSLMPSWSHDFLSPLTRQGSNQWP